MLRVEPPRLAILGAGPIGLEAALYAAGLQLPCAIYESGQVGAHLQRWGHVRLFTPFTVNSTPLGRATLRAERADLPSDADLVTGREHVQAYLKPLAVLPTIRTNLRLQTRVIGISRRGVLRGDPDTVRSATSFLLLLRDQAGRESTAEADVVLDCTGTFGQPRGLGMGGLPAIGQTTVVNQISQDLPDILGEQRTLYADKTVLVVGTGYSAATSVTNLADLAQKHPATWVIWLARGNATQPIRRNVNDPLRERDRLAVRANALATRGDGCVEYHPQSIVEEITASGPEGGLTIRGHRDGKPMTWHADRLIGNVGFGPDDGFLRELRLQYDPLTAAPSALPSEPNFYVLGSKSFGRNSNFFLADGFAEIREVFRRITRQPSLDLYERP